MEPKAGRMGNRGSVKTLIVLVLLGAAVYAGFKLAGPYYAYKDLEGTMAYWARVALAQGDSRYGDLRDKMRWTIEQHQIPLSVEDVEIVASPDGESLTVSAEYDVVVTFPGYEYRHRFRPHVEVAAGEE